MKKDFFVKGMSCSHCSNRLEKVLNNIEGITATVNLEKGVATITGENILDSTIKDAIENAGFSVAEIK